MRIHHLNCISSCPLGGRLMDGRTRGILERGQLACHCVLVEAAHGLALIDTGLGLRDVADPRGRLSAFFLTLLCPDLREQMTAVRQIARMGFDPHDVRDIVLTHLDFDHAGGLDDFPHARVHLLASERGHAMQRRTWLDRQRYRPQQWSTQDNWIVYPPRGGEDWLGFDSVRDLQGMPPEILMVPLPGHTHGHTGVAIDGEDGWKLLAGDAYFCRHEMETEPSCTPGLRFYQWMMEKDREARLANQARLRAIHARDGDHVRIFCSHDPVEFESVAGRPIGEPAALVAPVPMARVAY